ncbi:MAG: 3-oxoacyl-ACP synthase, partial [Streptomyces sp.]|nr:3-oxoacyl-ACP synthase [Streptomyces sp.]
VAVRSFFLPPSVAAARGGAERARALIDGALDPLGHVPDGPLPITAVLDDSPVGEAFAAALGERAEYVPAGAGCLEPVTRVAAALAGGTGPARVVLTAAAEGNAAVCLVTPGGPDTGVGTQAEAQAEARSEEGGG